MAQISVQGPKAQEILGRLLEEDSFPEKYYSALFDRDLKGIRCAVSKTGYTGEGGYELYLAAEDAPASWEMILEAGKEDGILPCCSPIKAARELGSERRETVRSLSIVGVGDLRGAVPSTRGPGWTHQG